MKMWFGDTLLDASKKADDDDLRKALKKQSDECLGNPEGKDLSAIWLTEKDHVTVHGAKPTMTIPVIETQEGEVASKPTRATLRLNEPTPFSLSGKKYKNPDTAELQSTFNRVFGMLLAVGLATVETLKLKGSWKKDLADKANQSWKKYSIVPKK
jgi:hypothetical protein